jgi:hypothetical protein
MVIEVKYQTPECADDSGVEVLQIEYFEADAMPAKEIIEKKLQELALPFNKDTISISQQHEDVAYMRASGKRVPKSKKGAESTVLKRVPVERHPSRYQVICGETGFLYANGERI